MSRALAWTGGRVVSSTLLPSTCRPRSAWIDSRPLVLNTRRPAFSTVSKFSMSTKPTDFRVATYNVLCSHLAEPSHFPKCTPQNLDAPTRLKRVKLKLDSEIEKGAVICLQEVGTQWAGDLHVYFMSKGYAFVTANYGKFFNNYMGVALAWPMDKYEAVTVDITRVSDTRKWGREPWEDRERREREKREPSKDTKVGGSGKWGGPLETLMKLTGRGVKRPRETARQWEISRPMEVEDPWKMAERRFNQSLFARLRPKGHATGSNAGAFCVATYHMPCLFRTPSVMVMHTSMVVKHVTKLAGSDPVVLAGDFNFNPASECYKLATEGDLAPTSPDYPPVPAWEKNWSPRTGVGLSSAYKQVDGKEPNFTNNAKVEELPHFIDTLDYIFHTPGVTATKVLPLKHREEVNGPFPIAEEPSDHVMLAADYEFDRPPVDA